MKIIKKLFNNEIIAVFLGVLLILSALTACEPVDPVDPDKPDDVDYKSDLEAVDAQFLKFESVDQLAEAFEDVRPVYAEEDGIFETIVTSVMPTKMAATDTAAPSAAGGESRDFSETNIQVEGVDEADIIKTDGDYIYVVANNKLYIAKAYPAQEAELLSEIDLDDFRPSEIFIHEDRLLLFGNQWNFIIYEAEIGEKVTGDSVVMDDYYYGSSVVGVRLYDVEDREKPHLLRSVELEGDYVTSRKIGENVYFVVNSWPKWSYDEPIDIIPLYREDKEATEPVVEAKDIGYITPLRAENFITVASMSMTDEDKEVGKEVIVGDGENVFASLQNLYVAQTTYERESQVGEPVTSRNEVTVVTKFNLDQGNIKYQGIGKVPGSILNQFSMDEFDSHFRIATTKGNVWDKEVMSTNNVYVLDKDMELVGSLEDLAPGERIYSVRFMGKKGYIVTFKKVDPLFVIDLSDHTNPTVLGKLKIPGYSDYLHPYDETHIIGIGKDTMEALEDQIQDRGIDFAWYQGVKMAIFDVSDVSNPIEMHKVVIGDRGTESPVLSNHKAFLFDRERNLLVLPIRVAEVAGDEKFDESGYPLRGDIVFQGAYVYDITLDNGFDLRGGVSHNVEEDYLKSGYYMRYDEQIQRSLYIEDVLYTMSDAMLKLNDLDSLEELNVIEFD